MDVRSVAAQIKETLEAAGEAQATLLRLEFHAVGPDGVPELHFHVTDENDEGPDFVLRFDELAPVLAAIVSVQNELTLETINDGPLATIIDACPRTFHVSAGKLRTVRPPPAAAAGRRRRPPPPRSSKASRRIATAT